MKEDGYFKNGNIPWNKGKYKELDLEYLKKEYLSGKSTIDLAKEFNVSDRTIASRLKMMNIILRKKHSKQTIDKIKKTMKDRGIQPKEKYIGEAWNKGKTLHYDVWNKNKVGLQNSNKKGKTYEELYGKDNSNKYKKIIKEERAKQIFPLEDTSIEIKVKGFLEQLNIKFIQHYFIKDIRHSYQCDFFIPKQERINKNIVLETDGCYWHGCKECNKELNSKQRSQIAKDNKRNKELIGKGYKVFRLFEHEIKTMDLNNFKNRFILSNRYL